MKVDGVTPLGNICIVARINRELETIESVLDRAGIPFNRVHGNSSDKTDHSQVRIATMRKRG